MCPKTSNIHIVNREQSFSVGERNLKSNIVLMGEEGASVVDVTVCYESKRSLKDTSKEKCEKYQPLAEDLVARGLA